MVADSRADGFMSAMSSSAAPPIVTQNVAVNAVVAAAMPAIESQLSHLSDVSKFGSNFGNGKRRFFAIYAMPIWAVDSASGRTAISSEGRKVT